MNKLKEEQVNKKPDKSYNIEKEQTRSEEKRIEKEGGQGKEKEKDLSIRFSIEVAKEKIEKRFEEAAARYAAEAKLPGFRKGKVPIEVVKSRFKEAITDEVINKAIEEVVFEKIEKEKIKIAASPMVEKIDHKEGEDLKADIKVEVFPEINLPYFELIEIETPAKELRLEEYDEQKQIDAFLEANRRRVPVSGREIKEKDYVKLKYQSKMLDTRRMTPRKEADYLVSEEGEFEILDLYKELIGKKLKDRITVTRKYPEKYRKKIWAGKELEHYIEIEGIFELVKPNFDKEFLQGIGFQDEESFKKQLKADYEQYEKNHRENKTAQLIVDKLNEVIEFPVPQSLVNQEAVRIVSGFARGPIDFKDEKEAKEYLAPFKTRAEKSVKFSLIVDAIREKFKLEVASDDLENEYKKISEKNNIPLKEVRKYYLNSKKEMQNLKESLLNVKVMDFLKEKIKIKEV